MFHCLQFSRDTKYVIWIWQVEQLKTNGSWLGPVIIWHFATPNMSFLWHLKSRNMTSKRWNMTLKKRKNFHIKHRKSVLLGFILNSSQSLLRKQEFHLYFCVRFPLFQMFHIRSAENNAKKNQENHESRLWIPAILLNKKALTFLWVVIVLTSWIYVSYSSSFFRQEKQALYYYGVRKHYKKAHTSIKSVCHKKCDFGFYLPNLLLFMLLLFYWSVNECKKTMRSPLWFQQCVQTNFGFLNYKNF